MNTKIVKEGRSLKDYQEELSALNGQISFAMKTPFQFMSNTEKVQLKHSIEARKEIKELIKNLNDTETKDA